MKTVDQLLIEYINDCDNDEINFALARHYHDIQQTASAVSYYLRCAERTKSIDLQYECLIHAARCFDSQKKRNLTVRGLLQHAIVIHPTRPESYWMLSTIYENDHSFKDHWMNAYTIASIGMFICKESPPLRHDMGFPGLYALKFQRAVNAWWAGLCDEARILFLELKQDISVNSFYRKLIDNNINIIASKASQLHTVYKTKTLDNFLDSGFKWGPVAKNEWFKNIVEKEIFQDNVYQKFVKVKENDIVLDIGASVGPFTYSIKNSKPSKVICVEPHKQLFETLLLNTKDAYALCINKAIGAIDGKEIQKGLFNENFIETQEDNNIAEVETITFKTLLKENDITKVNFMKLDCEGGEYDIFTQENFPWIRDNVDYIVGEWHLSDDNLKAKFRDFRDNYLRHFDNIEVFSFDNVDVKHSLWSDWFIEYYKTVTIYINNTTKKSKQPAAFNSQFKQRKKIADKWKYSVSPTLEFTTIIPEKGCVVDCVFCPQRTLVQNYTGERRLSLDNFKRVIDKLPQPIRVTFAGFTEPWLNSDCTDMLLYAHEKGHPISVFTTMVGVSIEDIERIKHVPFAGNPNGGFVVHLPDQERKAKHPITKKYIEAIEHLAKVQHEIQNFTVMTMGTVHEAVRHAFPSAPTYAMWSRAGNLIGERMLKPELQQQDFLYINHGDKQMTCGCDERLYHNVMLPNGDVSLCCMDYGLEEITGNLFEQEYNDVIPDPYEVFKLCRQCENAVDVNSQLIKSERLIYKV